MTSPERLEGDTPGVAVGVAAGGAPGDHPIPGLLDDLSVELALDPEHPRPGDAVASLCQVQRHTRLDAGRL